MRIAIDLDNVVVDWQNRWADLYEQWFDVKIPAVKRATWNACMDETHFESMDQFYNWFFVAGGWDISYLKGAQGALYQLSQRPNTFIHFCTSRPPAGRASAADLAGKWSTRVDFLNNASKHLSKADVWIDDSPEVLENLAANGKQAIRFEQPWNKSCTAFTHTAKNWREVLAILDKEYQ